MNTKIIDISSNNGKIDFTKLYNSMQPDSDGKKRIIIRTSKGYGDVDTQCATYAAAAKAAGFTISYYHFAYPDTHTGGTVESDSYNEADYFCNTIKTLPDYEFLVVDLEQQSSLSQSDYAKWLKSFLDHVYARTSTSCIIYTYADYLNRMLPDNHSFGSYRLWIANYSVSSNPPLPKGFNHWFMWQFSEKGSVAGINTPVDLSTFNPSTI